MEFSISMALVDFIPVIFYAVASIMLQRDLYNKMSKGAFALFAAGTLDVIFAGALKALYKLLYAAGVCDFTALSTLFFPMQSLGFILAGLGVLAMLTHKQGTALAAAAPPFFSGTFLFVGLMVLGLGFANAGYCVLAAKLKKRGLIPLFALTFFCCMGMGYLSSQDFAKASMNWLAEGINVIGQGALLIGAVKLRKAGLRELKI